MATFDSMNLEDWRRFFDLSLDMLCVAGTDGFFKRLNPAWERTLGWSIDELCARPYLEFVHPDDRDNTGAHGEGVINGHHVLAFENRYRCKDGTYRRLHWNGMPLPEQGLVYAAARDVTAMHDALEAVQRTRDELEQRVHERTAELHRVNAELGSSHAKTLRALTTPVVRIHQGVLLLPIIGEVDSYRAGMIMETVLSRVVDERARVLILDIAGLPSMDEEFARYLLQTTAATRMLGAETIITGIGVNAARTLIHLGVDVSTITTTAQLAEGLDLALAIVGKKVGRR